MSDKERISDLSAKGIAPHMTPNIPGLALTLTAEAIKAFRAAIKECEDE